MATFVALGQNAGLDLATVVCGITAGDEQKVAVADSPLGKLASERKYAELISSVVAQLDKIVMADEEQCDAALTIAFALMQQFCADSLNETVPVIAKQLASADVQHNAQLRLRLLTTLFNVASATSAQFATLKSLMEFALASGDGDVVVPQLGAMEAWMAQNQMSKEDMSQFYLLAYKILASEKLPDREMLHKYLLAVESDKEVAAAAVVAALKAGEHVDALYELATVRALEGDAKFGKTYELLSIFANDTLPAYLAWYGSNKDYLASLELDHAALSARMSTLTIAKLAFENDVLSYATLQKELAVADSDAVEMVLIEAIASGVLEAKLDQAKEEVIVERSVHAFRHFSEQTWQTLGAKLALWHANVDEVARALARMQEDQQEDYREQDGDDEPVDEEEEEQKEQ